MVSIVVRVLLFYFILLLLDFYVFSGIKSIIYSDRLRVIFGWIYWSVSVLFLVLCTYVFLTFSRNTGPSAPSVKWTMAAFVFLYIPKLFIFFFLGIEDVYRIIRAFCVTIYKIVGNDPSSSISFFESRRKFFGQMAALIATIPALGILYGITKGKYNFKIHRVELAFKNLPDAFNGTTITQISDLHIGSFDDKEEVLRAVNMINAEKSDLILFTGDLVNNTADEMTPWMNVINKLTAPMGKYSILGNHDYGDYAEWPSTEAKKANMEQLFKIHDELGFKLLRNENTRIEKNNSYIELLGMENWGAGFAKYGDFKKTLLGTQKDSFKILMSHDPSHWEKEVMQHSEQIDITLAGHTHGMQFGLEIPGIKISPIQLKYKRWAGLYEENNRFLYVNRGLGFIGFPGRVGIWPEITVITLKVA